MELLRSSSVLRECSRCPAVAVFFLSLFLVVPFSSGVVEEEELHCESPSKMSVLPYLMDQLSRPTIYDQHFGLGLLDDDLFVRPRTLFPMLNMYERPFRFNSALQSGLSSIQNDENNFKVNLDVQQFKPEEVSVKVVDGYVVVDGKHEERTDEHGYISRQFTRRYKVPENVDPSAITSTLFSDGVLSVGAPKKVETANKSEIPIQIVQTNKPSIKASQKKKKEECCERMDDTGQ